LNLKEKIIMRWQRKLTKKQLAHVREHTQRSTLGEVLVNVEHQSKMHMPCYECLSIGRKLGLQNQPTLAT